MPRHVTSCHVMYLMSRHVMSLNVTSRHVTSFRVTSCHVMSCLAPSCHVMPRHVMSRHVISWHHVTSCYVISCRKSRDSHTTNASTDNCQLTFSTCNWFKLSMTVFVGCPEGCRYHTASAVYDLVLFIFLFFIQRSFSETILPDRFSPNFQELCILV